MEDWKLGYLAGIVDGEGTIGIARYRADGTKRPQYRIHVVVTSGSISMLEFIQKDFGGKISLIPERDINKKACYRLTWVGHYAKELIPKIIDKLQIKREHAEIIMSFPISRLAGGFTWFTEEENATRLSSYEKVKKLNERGNGVVFTVG